MEHWQECDCDGCLVAQMQASDAAERRHGWQAWYQRDGAVLLAFMQRRCRTLQCLEQSEDLVQDCFVIGFRNVSSGRYVNRGKALPAYLHGIAKRLIYETVRLQRRETGYPQHEEAELEMMAIGLDDRACLTEVLGLIKVACEQQPPLYQSVVAGLYGDGKSPDEMAQELCKSNANIRIIAHRTVNSIVRDLARHGVRLSSSAVRSCLKELPSLQGSPFGRNSRRLTRRSERIPSYG